MVVRDLRREVVEDVRLGDAVGEGIAEPAEECAAGEGERGTAVVWEVRVGVLEEGDEDEVVDLEVGHAVDPRHLREATQ